MKELTTYINEKLDLDKVNVMGDFPIEGTIDEMGEFLNKNRFKKIEKYEPGFAFSQVSSQDTRCYLISDSHSWIKFGDMSKHISKKNPIFCVVKEHYEDRCFIEYGPNDYDYYDNKREFLELINKTLKF